METAWAAEFLSVRSKTHCAQSDDHSHFIMEVMAMRKRLNMSTTHKEATVVMRPIFDAALSNVYSQCRAKSKTDANMIEEVKPVLPLMVEHV